MTILEEDINLEVFDQLDLKIPCDKYTDWFVIYIST